MGVAGCCHHYLAWRESFKSPPLFCRYGLLLYLKLIQAMLLLLLFSLRLDKCSLTCRSSSRYTVNSGIDMACPCLLGAGCSSPPPYKLYRLSILFAFTA